MHGNDRKYVHERRTGEITITRGERGSRNTPGIKSGMRWYIASKGCVDDDVVITLALTHSRSELLKIMAVAEQLNLLVGFTSGWNNISKRS